MTALVVFGGVYGNLAALESLLDWAAKRGAAANQFVCTGDLAAYCADGAAVCDLVRKELAGRAILIRGNCERALAEDAEDCGCGFESGSACAILSDAWFRHARSTIPPESKQWMGGLPTRRNFIFAGRRIAAVHAGSGADNEFIFPSTPEREKCRQLAALEADGVICGHSGIPFSQLIDGTVGTGETVGTVGMGGRSLMWHNSGALGMPANDGTGRVWFSLWEESGSAIRIRHIPLEYDFVSSREAMRLAGMPEGYRQCLKSGIWPSDSVLPPAEKSRGGRALALGEINWD